MTFPCTFTGDVLGGDPGLGSAVTAVLRFCSAVSVGVQLVKAWAIPCCHAATFASQALTSDTHCQNALSVSVEETVSAWTVTMRKTASPRAPIFFCTPDSSTLAPSPGFSSSRRLRIASMNSSFDISLSLPNPTINLSGQYCWIPGTYHHNRCAKIADSLIGHPQNGQRRRGTEFYY